MEKWIRVRVYTKPQSMTQDILFYFYFIYDNTIIFLFGMSNQENSTQNFKNHIFYYFTIETDFLFKFF